MYVKNAISAFGGPLSNLRSVAQLSERPCSNAEVAGEIPAGSANLQAYLARTMVRKIWNLVALRRENALVREKRDVIRNFGYALQPRAALPTDLRYVGTF